MKKIIGLVIGGIILIVIGSLYFKYIYVPKNMTFRIKYIDLKKEIKGDAKEVYQEFNGNSFHTRISFQKVNDSITYTFDILNDGSIPAKLMHDPFIFGKDNITKKYVTRYLTYLDGEDIKKGDTLNPGERVTVQYKIIFAEQEVVASADGNHFEATIYFPYFQNR